MGLTQRAPAMTAATRNVCDAKYSLRSFSSSEMAEGPANMLRFCHSRDLEMTSIRPFKMESLFDVNGVNLDPFTENFHPLFYLEYLCEWPDLFFQSEEESLKGTTISGYMMGKTEGKVELKEWHTHITAVTVNRDYRRIGLASDLCVHLDQITAVQPHHTFFVDLFVKVTNPVALQLYEKLGYSVFRRVIGYYARQYPTEKIASDEDAFDMRKLQPRDAKHETVRADGQSVYVYPSEVAF